VRIHPNQRLEDALARPDDAREAAEAMRGLIEKIVLISGLSAARSRLSCAAS